MNNYTAHRDANIKHCGQSEDVTPQFYLQFSICIMLPIKTIFIRVNRKQEGKSVNACSLVSMTTNNFPDIFSNLNFWQFTTECRLAEWLDAELPHEIGISAVDAVTSSAVTRPVRDWTSSLDKRSVLRQVTSKRKSLLPKIYQDICCLTCITHHHYLAFQCCC